MTTEHFEQQLLAEAPAIHFLSDEVADYLLNRGHAAKIGEIASQTGKRIGAGAKLIRQTLTDNPLFVGEERRWNLSARTLFNRPVEGAVQQTLRIIGKPMTLSALSTELAVLNARPAEYFQQMLPRFLSGRPQNYLCTSDGSWGLLEWLLDLTSTDEEELMIRNFFDKAAAVKAEIAPLRKVSITAKMSYSDAALAILTAAGCPLDTQKISLLIYLKRGESFDPLACYLEWLADERLYLLSQNQWLSAEAVAGFTASLQKLSTLADAALAEEEVWEGPYQASPEDLNEINDYMSEHEHPEKLSDLVETVLEYARTSPRFESVYLGIEGAIKLDERFVLVGNQTFALPDSIPTAVQQVPEALLPESIDTSAMAEVETDAELNDEGLEDKLAVWVHDPRYEDFGGEHEVELSQELMDHTPDETRIPLLYDHREMGTLKLRQADMSFFPTDTPLACVTVHSEKIGTFQMWISNEELLIHGLNDWYAATEIPIGAVITFRRGSEPDDYLISWDGEIDNLIALSDERVSELMELHIPVEDESWPVCDIMRRALAGHMEGTHFLTLWAEINVVRRTPKRVIASNLSSYHCFVPINNTERWKVDERKVEQGRKKTKKKFII